MQLSIPDNSFLDSFEHLGSIPLDMYGKNELNLFMLRINANEFDYELLVQNLLEPIITYSVSRKVKADYSNRPHTLTKKALERFIEYCNNTGELGELSKAIAISLLFLSNPLLLKAESITDTTDAICEFSAKTQ